METTQIKDTPNYGTPGAVMAVVDTMQTPERIRASNRALIDSLMNGRRPYTDAEVADFQIQVNVNWGEGSKILQDANRQVNNALLHKGNFVTCTALDGPPEKRDEWGAKFTTNLNRILKRGKSGKKYLFLLKSRNASLVMHGIGFLMWSNSWDWMPRFIPLEDALIPTGTLQDFSNMTHFAVNLYLTPWELMNITHGDSKKAEQAGWNLKAVRTILNAYGKLNTNYDQYNWFDRPEEMVNVWKQNSVTCNSDSVPKVQLVAFYYRSPDAKDGKEKWYRKICFKSVTASDGVNNVSVKDDFVFDSGATPFAEDIDRIISVQFGDCNLVAPQTYHATRGLGEMLYAVIECMNRLRCQWMQHVFENLLMLLRVSNPTEQDRPKMFNLRPYGVIEDGVSIIPKEERHQIDPRLIESAMSESRQLMSENSASFVQDVDNGTGKEQTLGEAQIRLQTANKMVSSMLDMMYTLETFQFEEIVRRFLQENPIDPDIIKFQNQCKKDMIPPEMMKPDKWQVDADRVMGGGDQALAQQEASALFQAKASFDPTSQRIIDRNWVRTMTRNPALAELLVPEKAPEVSEGRKAAESVFGTLMQGTPIGLVEGIEQRDYVIAMMDMLTAVIQRIEGTDNMGTMQEVVGLQVVAADIGQHLELMSQDPANKEFVTAAGKELGKQMNLVKAFQQRLEEKGAQSQPDPEAIAKAQATQAASEQKLQNNQASFEQKMQQSEAKFQQKMQQSMETQMAKIQQMQAEALAEIKAYQAKTQAEIDAMREKAAAAPTTET